MSTDAITLHEAGSGSTTSLTPERFAGEADDPRSIVLDLREADERVLAGSIAGAIHVPRGVLEFRADPSHAGHDGRLRPDARVLLYCSDGARSILAGDALRSLGYRDVAHLRGGVDAWTAARLPLIGRLPPPY